MLFLEGHKCVEPGVKPRKCDKVSLHINEGTKVVAILSVAGGAVVKIAVCPFCGSNFTDEKEKLETKFNKYKHERDRR